MIEFNEKDYKAGLKAFNSLREGKKPKELKGNSLKYLQMFCKTDKTFEEIANEILGKYEIAIKPLKNEKEVKNKFLKIKKEK